mmetsp:Transcript_10852/g.16189  ORF Transcript_10852/g.16189 Transcript_10852/m.16189 type:complete len:340 (+) Transcript_10852:154-1173(+)
MISSNKMRLRRLQPVRTDQKLAFGIGGLTLLFFALFSIRRESVYLHHLGLTPVPQLRLGSNDCLSKVQYVRNIKLYSQNDEDGALLQILRCMGGHGNKEYFEFGSEDGMQVNTHILRDLYGWHGHLLDGSNENPDINLHQEFFTPSNIVKLMEKYKASKDLDVLSVDTDMDDFYILREILLAGYRPRVLIVEYNRNFGADWAVSTIAKPVGHESRKSVGWANGDCYLGASAPAFFLLAKEFGYTPVFSNRVNLMFVPIGQAADLGLAIPSPQNFPDPGPTRIHKDCSGRIWKKIDAGFVKESAANKLVSHEEFANGFDDIMLTAKEYGGNWRMFEEVGK